MNCTALLRRSQLFRLAALSTACAISMVPLLHASNTRQRGQSSKAIIAYVFTRGRVLAPGEVDGRKVTRINYAFANIKDGKMVEGYPHDDENFAALNALKHDNPNLQVLVSVGGWDWSGAFSDMALTKQSRRRFAESVVAFIEKYHLDGLDIDWEYPGMAGATDRFRPEDRQNYTLLLHELRQRFGHEQKKLHRRLLLSIATGASAKFLEHTEMKKVERYVDSVNLMTYDFYSPGSDKITGHQAPLYVSPLDPKQYSADLAVQNFERAGVPARKIVLGMPFYGKRWAEVPGEDHGLFQPGKEPPRSGYGPGFDAASLMANGYTRYWDSVAQVPYLYNPATRMFVSYEDAQSVAGKCKYVLSHRLGGVMFWTYESDTTGALLNAVNASFHHGVGLTAAEMR